MIINFPYLHYENATVLVRVFKQGDLENVITSLVTHVSCTESTNIQFDVCEGFYTVVITPLKSDIDNYTISLRPPEEWLNDGFEF